MSNKKISFITLQELYEKEKSYVAATIYYIQEILNIEIEEFNVSELPSEWIMCLKTEALQNNLIEKNNKNSFSKLFK